MAKAKSSNTTTTTSVSSTPDPNKCIICVHWGDLEDGGHMCFNEKGCNFEEKPIND